MRRRRPSLLSDAVRGAIAGAIGTYAMDVVTTALVRAQSPEDAERERAAQPNGRSSVGNLIDRAEDALGARLPEESRPLAAQAVHYGLGILPGALYGAFRRRLPAIAAGSGLLYGLAIFVLNDEVMNTELGLAGSYAAYPMSSHLRGALGHAVLGITTDTTLDLLSG
jgi:hypothetical protein